ncbi:PREDICTED: maternal effect embryo [Prunus dulcis]|uniref:PREDICTED: maternal effect embryo n=1 Tax=Prunus dulcis TaxID=3755 RepID=A0A5E4EQV1_PRUDU|nr:uncharacterized protein LOC117629600 [Prunus dulcis]VVA17239.1 PREDICTED: maternal effect embryo [Prunus dulcis]
MVGATKPSRSDEVLEADEQLKIANQIRAQFDSAAPKRPIKPNRSEPDSSSSSSSTPNPVDYSIFDQPNIPELDKFRSLQSQSPVILSSAEGATTVQDEFVDTQYYKELNSIDKQHHMTGSGFIKVVREGGSDFDLQLAESHDDVIVGLMKIRSNPATNDWVPRTDEDEVFVNSSKPNRSESSY